MLSKESGRNSAGSLIHCIYVSKYLRAYVSKQNHSVSRCLRFSVSPSPRVLGRAKTSSAWRVLLITDSKVKVNESLRPAVFLDRDGTIIDDIGYLSDPGGVAFYQGVPQALKRLQDRGYLLVVVTNQSGIGRGYFNEETAIAVNLAMVEMLREEGVVLASIYYCPHHPGDGCRCRKPGLLMVERAVVDLGIDKDRSWFVGDIDKDVLTGMNAGLKPILVETGKTGKGDLPEGVKRCETVVEAVAFILDQEPVGEPHQAPGYVL